MGILNWLAQGSYSEGSSILLSCSSVSRLKAKICYSEGSSILLSCSSVSRLKAKICFSEGSSILLSCSSVSRLKAKICYSEGSSILLSCSSVSRLKAKIWKGKLCIFLVHCTNICYSLNRRSTDILWSSMKFHNRTTPLNIILNIWPSKCSCSWFYWLNFKSERKEQQAY